MESVDSTFDVILLKIAYKLDYKTAKIKTQRVP